MSKALERTIEKEELHREGGVDSIVEDLFSGKAHFDAWSAVCAALTEVDPTWNKDTTKSAARKAVEWILKHKEKP